MDRINELLALLRAGEINDEQRAELSTLLGSETLAELTDEELASLEAEIVAAADDVDDDVEALGVLADAADTVRAETTARDEADAERAAAADELRGRIRPVADATDDDPDEDEVEEDEEEDEEDEPSVDAAPDDVEEPTAQVAAAPRTTPLSRTRTPARRQPRTTESRQGATIVAAAEVPGVSAGAPMEFDQLGEAFAHRLQSVAQGSRRGATGRFPVGSLTVEYPQERSLVASAETNQERIERVLSPDVLVAAGGLCAPVEVDYSLPQIASTERPLRDALPRFGAERGGIRFMASPTLADVTPGVGIWTEAHDSDPGGIIPDEEGGNGVLTYSETKNTVRIECGVETEVTVDAITLQMETGNFARRTFPEQWAAWWNLAQAAHARVAENKLWDDMVAAAIAVSTTEALGATRDLLAAIDQAIAAYRFRHRMSRGAALRFALPDFVRDMIRADLVRQFAGDETYAVTNAQIDAWFRERGVTVAWTLDAGSNNDGLAAAQAAGALGSFPATVEGILYHEGAFLHLDGGTLDLGVELRDSSQIATNDVAAFMETFEAVALRGQEAVAITFDLCPNGEAQGTVAAAIC